MDLLLDTHILLWWLGDSPTLPSAARDLISNPRNRIFVSAAVAWEMSIKRAAGKLDAPEQLASALEANGFQALPISLMHALLAGGLPPHHTDPFDRMLVAQAALDGLTLVTHDRRMVEYNVAVHLV